MITVSYHVERYNEDGTQAGTLVGSKRLVFDPDYGDTQEDALDRAIRLIKRECTHPHNVIVVGIYGSLSKREYDYSK